jgi:hypothetical protein
VQGQLEVLVRVRNRLLASELGWELDWEMDAHCHSLLC